MEDHSKLVSLNCDIEGSADLPSIELFLGNKISITEDIVEEDELEEVDERERIHLQKVSSLVEAAYQSVEKSSKLQSFQDFTLPASETSSCASTHHAASLPDSLDGGKAEVEELKTLPASFETALQVNQALQKRLSATLSRLEKTLQHNILRQMQLKQDEEEQGLFTTHDRDRDSRDKYPVRPSSFAMPYFKDRTGMPAPMNQDAKYKVDHGYLDLYSTRLRTWLTSEQNLLVCEVQEEWKNQLLNDWKNSLKTAEWKLKNQQLSLDEKTKLEDEVKSCRNHVSFFTNVSPEKIDMPRGSKLDWDRVSAKAFDGYRSAEECQLLWENQLHPSINQSNWTEEEDIQIQEHVLECKNRKPDWEALAQDLMTGRTAFSVMQRWVSFIRPTIEPARWTASDSKKLEDTVNMLRVGSHIPWALIGQHLTGYTKAQLQTRWKLINPDQSKGPFSIEEDFVLIKGLYKFNLNFELIAHFLPGRNRVQVRERFKRSILPGLTFCPWTWREDKKIIENCSLGSQHWRRMTKLLPKRDACQIRQRFYVLHFWQSISNEKKLPPPLFPISLSTKPLEVKKIREKIITFNPDVKIYLDSIQTNKNDMKLVVMPFEERRAKICKQKNSETLAKFLEEKLDEPARPKLVRKRKRGRYGVRTQPWPDQSLVEFFLPGRPKLHFPTINTEGKEVKDNFHRVSQALQLRVKESVTPDEVRNLKHLNIRPSDSKLVNETLVSHHETANYGPECFCCSGQKAEIIPLMPPNLMTTGAFLSLLLHKPKLEQMASKEFQLFKTPRSQLHKLGDKPETIGQKKVITKLEIPEERVQNLTQGETEVDQTEDISTEIASVPAKRPRGRPSLKRKAAEMASIVNYVYSQEEKKPNLLKPTLEKEVIEPPTPEQLLEMQLEGECSNFRKRPLDMSKEKLIEEEDGLLFHRLVSLFFWPALFTLQSPSKENIHLSKELALQKRLGEIKAPDTISYPRTKNSIITDLDPQEQEKLIEKMEAIKKIKNRRQRDVYYKRNTSLTADDMKKRIYKKEVIALKRSLVMKKAWEMRRQGVASPKIKKPDTTCGSRPRSARVISLRNRRIQEDEKAEQQRIELEETQLHDDADDHS